MPERPVADEGAAAEQIVSGKTPWLPLSDLADYFLGFEFPGGGAAHQGKTVKPFHYLEEADFDIIVGEWIEAGIAAGCIPAEPPA
jgi:hypothetical protein